MPPCFAPLCSHIGAAGRCEMQNVQFTCSRQCSQFSPARLYCKHVCKLATRSVYTLPIQPTHICWIQTCLCRAGRSPLFASYAQLPFADSMHANYRFDTKSCKAPQCKALRFCNIFWQRHNVSREPRHNARRCGLFIPFFLHLCCWRIFAFVLLAHGKKLQEGDVI